MTTLKFFLKLYYGHITFMNAAPQCEMNLLLTVSASKPGRIDQFLNCHVQGCDEPIALHVEVNVTVIWIDFI